MASTRPPWVNPRTLDREGRKVRRQQRKEAIIARSRQGVLRPVRKFKSPANLRRIEQRAILMEQKKTNKPEKVLLYERQVKEREEASKREVLEAREIRQQELQSTRQGKVFPVVVDVDQDSQEALAIAAQEYTSENDDSKLKHRVVYWTDIATSRVNNRGGLGVVYKCEEKWIHLSWRVLGHDFDSDLKICAIAKAIETAREHYERMEEKPHEVAIYTDTPATASYFANFRSTLDAQDPVEKSLLPAIVAAEELKKLGVKVELRYLPAKSNIEWSKKAGKAAGTGLHCVSALLEDESVSIIRGLKKNMDMATAAIF